MAYVANTAFEDRITNGRFNDLENIAGKFGTVSGSTLTPADCSAGWLCTRSIRLSAEGFEGVTNENTFAMIAATTAANAGTQVFACNPHDVQMLSDANGNNYAIGHKTLGLGTPSGRYGNFTHIIFDGMHEYRFGIGNVNGSVGSNKYFTIAAGQLKPASAAPTATGAVYFELVGTGTFTEGTSAAFDYVDVVAHTVFATA